MSKKNAQQYPHRKFLERLLALSEEKTVLQTKPPSPPDFIEINTGFSGLHFRYVVGQDKSRIEFYIHRPNATVNKRIFDELISHKTKIEIDFGGQLCWERLNGQIASRIAYRLPNGGSRDNEAKWQTIQTAMIGAMVRLEKALSPFIPKLMPLK
jgi:hypothetical protein